MLMFYLPIIILEGLFDARMVERETTSFAQPAHRTSDEP